MQHLGDFRINDYVTFGVQLHRFSSGAVYAPTGNVTYTFYEDNSTSGAPTGGNLAQLNSKTGLYSARVQLTTAAGFEAGKDYFIHVEATVDGVAAAELFMFRVVGVPTVDVVQIGGDAQSATDLKDFADDGYDPSTNKVQGVVLTDTVTTYTGNTPQTGDAYAKVDTEIATIISDIATLATYVDTEVAAIKAKTDNLPADPADASDIAASLATITGYIDTEVAAILAAVDTEVAAIKAKTDNLPADPADASDIATSFTTLTTKLRKYVQLLARKDSAIATDNATEVTEINADGGSGSGAFVNTTDSQEALRDRGDSAWTTATGFSTLDAAGVRAALGMASANLDTQLGLLATAATLATVAGYIDTEVAAIKAKTDNLPIDPADASDIASAFSTVNSTLSAIAAYIDTEVAAILAAVDTEVAAIKAKTDNLPASPAAVGSAMTLDTDAVTAAAIATAAANKIADILLRRATSNIEASSDGESLSLKSLYGAAAMMTHPKDANSGTSIVLKKSDGVTTLATIPIDTDAAAEPIVGTS